MTELKGTASSEIDVRGRKTRPPVRRLRSTRRSVLLADFFARWCIIIGGIATIGAVSLVCLFLVWVVLPLFQSAEIRALPTATLQRSAPSPTPADSPSAAAAEDTAEVADGAAVPALEAATADSASVLAFGTDEFANLFWTLRLDGTVEVHRNADGRLIDRHALAGDVPIVAGAYDERGGNVVLAYADRTIRIGSVEVATEFVADSAVTPALRQLSPGQTLIDGGRLIERTAEGLYRAQRVRIELLDPIEVDVDSAIRLIDASFSSKGKVVGFLTADGTLTVAQITERKNLLTGKVTTRLRSGSMLVERVASDGLPSQLMLSGLGDNILLLWEDGLTQRFDTRTIAEPQLAETIDLVPGEERLIQARFLVGKTSIVTGDSAGNVRVWFRIKPEEADTIDGAQLVAARSLAHGPGAVLRIHTSPSARIAAILFESGTLAIFHTTSSKQLASLQVETTGDPLLLTMPPRNDGLLLRAGDSLHRWQLDARHPEITWSSVFRPVWYEGYERPEHVWQSSSGTDDFEEKYGLMPLIFGTFKATLYSMLFAVPLALLAAVYTSEFLHSQWRARVKPTIEIMASLPSVVLGFLAALVFAPLLEDLVPQTLTALVTVPFSMLLGAQIWQLLPARTAVRMERWRMVGIVAMLPVGLWLSAQIGPLVERWMFYGDIKAWLDGQIGSAEGGWMFLTLPLSTLVTIYFLTIVITPLLRQRWSHLSRQSFALLDLGKFILASVATLGLAYLMAVGLTAIGWDPRGLYLGTYVQRNSLIVGAIMGFAVIPIIYTISDDALTAVPDSLRAASLGAGATRWQTAVRVVIPTAMSGLFSAMMVGLGRAVGETMIVLMAAGNTPIMDWNIFNGFRTLSANIAVELPEAVLGSTHYRMLFLAALVLFLLTFVVNTVAEVVRLRFRKRAFQL
ncbi:MAG: hypothetical protein KatS3mg111_1056 [Pirellulaceae bacterium]|nr:MAG: hypothetical protein KatS3mg111_1056 [Pirellulaceae bacterium]